LHGKSGGTADTWLVIQDAPNRLEDFSFVLSFEPSVLSFDRILETPHTGWGWQVTQTELSAKDGKNRIRIRFIADHTDRTLAKDRDYLLCRLRFSVQRNRTSFLGLEDTEGDMKNWRMAGASFFHTEQSTPQDNTDTTAHISCFVNTLTFTP
jgi:hypothetical protein